MKLNILPTFLAGGFAACSLVMAALNATSIGIRDVQLTLVSADGSNEHVQK
jgi:hypothetical protein